MKTFKKYPPKWKGKKKTGYYLHAERHVEMSSNILQGRPRAESNRLAYTVDRNDVSMRELFVPFSVTYSSAMNTGS